MTKKELANKLHDQKYNCAQAVACAFAEEVGVDIQTLFKACEGFGLGMGGMNGTCGAISGAVMLAGFINSDGNTTSPTTKASTYQLSKAILERFEAQNKATRCRDLKGIDTGVVLRSCPGCIEDAVEIVQEVLKL
ncbi:MAG: C_GCAxxG_C_C family protein [Lachnospiraceae bacterium]|nr:C_GCAxxG_C_C family protein [Lachnospiraceae bacterium]